jgi:hypothetical protein
MALVLSSLSFMTSTTITMDTSSYFLSIIHFNMFDFIPSFDIEEGSIATIIHMNSLVNQSTCHNYINQV